jgi:hypothetical protein
MPTPEELDQRLEALRRIVDAARFVVSRIREYFPVDGEEWDDAESADDSVVVDVVRSQMDLERLLTPPAGSLRLGPAERGSEYACGSIVGPYLWKDFDRYVQRIFRCHEALLEHYRWKELVTKGKPHRPNKLTPWTWPAVPPIKEERLAAMERAAARLDGLIGEFVAARQHGELPADNPEQKPPQGHGPGRPPTDPVVVGYALALREGDGRLTWKETQSKCKLRFPQSELAKGDAGNFKKVVSRALKKHEKKGT